MEDDLYQPSQNATMTNQSYPQPASPSSSPTFSSSQATQTLSHLLNIPESFVEHYNRVNGSNPLLAAPNTASVELPSGHEYPNYQDDLSYRVSPFKQYANPDLPQYQTPRGQQEMGQQEYDSQQSHQLHMQPPQFFVRPELLLNRSNTLSSRRRRITTLEQPELSGVKQPKGDDVLLFNTDIEPSTMMSNTSFFDHDFNNDNSLFIMNSDLDRNPVNINGSASLPVPGFESDYVMMDDYAESDISDESDDDDDNYFQDEDDFDDNLINTNGAEEETLNSHFTPIMPIKDFSPKDEEEPMDFGGFMEDVHKPALEDNMDLCEPPLKLNTADHEATQDIKHEEERNLPQHNAPSMHSTPQVASLPPKELHRDAPDEIDNNEVIHHCDLINPGSGQPCNKSFTRPYDLVRHQETIHATVKKIFRCVICEGRFNGGPGNGKSKTFSRGDALSRHIKVKHGFGGKEALDLINEAKLNVEYVPIEY